MDDPRIPVSRDPGSSDGGGVTGDDVFDLPETFTLPPAQSTLGGEIHMRAGTGGKRCCLPPTRHRARNASPSRRLDMTCKVMGRNLRFADLSVVDCSRASPPLPAPDSGLQDFARRRRSGFRERFCTGFAAITTFTTRLGAASIRWLKFFACSFRGTGSHKIVSQPVLAGCSCAQSWGLHPMVGNLPASKFSRAS